MPARELTGEMSAGFAAGEGTGTGMGQGWCSLSLPSASLSLCVSLASCVPSPPLPPGAQLKGYVHPTAQAGTEISGCFLWGFIDELVSASWDEPVPGVLQQRQPCTGATGVVIGLCEIITLAKVQFYPRMSA